MSDWLLPQLLAHGAALLGSALLLNALVTFVGALGLALLAARIVGSPRLAKLLLLSPWLRVSWEVLRGATPGAYVLSQYAGTKGALGSFQLGVGASAPLVPLVHAELNMQGGDQRYGYSIGDLLGHWLFRHVGATPMLLALGLVLAVSATLLAARVRQFRLWRARLERVAATASTVESLRVAGRAVQVLTHSADLGPFTSGILRARIWLPAQLAGSERAAVLQHELAHVRELDVLWFGIVGVLSDLFWFVPGSRYLERCVHERAEEAADALALAHGVAPRALAQSILAHVGVTPPGAPATRRAGSAARLQRRLSALVPRPRESRLWLALRLVLALSLTLSVFRSVFFGYV